MANDSWQYQGRQENMWFGHGTKPDGKSAGPLIQRAANAGHALVAALPAGQRNNPGYRLNDQDHARLTKALIATMLSIPADIHTVATTALDSHPALPGVNAFIDAVRQLKTATTQADLRAATDKLAESAQAMGPSNFKSFLRHVDDHIAAAGVGSRTISDPNNQLAQNGPFEPDSAGVSPSTGPNPLDPAHLNKTLPSAKEMQEVANAVNNIYLNNTSDMNPHLYRNKPDITTEAQLPFLKMVILHTTYEIQTEHPEQSA